MILDFTHLEPRCGEEDTRPSMHRRGLVLTVDSFFHSQLDTLVGAELERNGIEILSSVLIAHVAKTDAQFSTCCGLLGMHKTTAVLGVLLMSLL